MQPPLCSCLKAWVPNLPSWQPLKRTTMIEGHLKFASPTTISFHPPYIHRRQLYPHRVRLQWCILVSKSMHSPAGVRAQQVADWQILPWTLSQIALGKKLCVAIPCFPVEYGVIYLFYFSWACLRAPPILTHSPFRSSVSTSQSKNLWLELMQSPRSEQSAKSPF